MLMHEDDGMMGQFLVKSPCALQFVSQPSSVQSEVGSNVQFTINATSPDAILYQWQTDIGLGWQNLTNAGQYSGVNTPTLTVSNTSLANNNQIFRCQIQISNDCISNSQTAVLEVGTSDITIENSKFVLVFPNPSESTFNISSNEIIQSIQVIDVFGRIVFEANPSNNVVQIDANGWASGTYLLIIDGAVQNRLLKN